MTHPRRLSVLSSSFALITLTAVLPGQKVVEIQDVTQTAQVDATAKKKPKVAVFRLVDEDNKPLAGTKVSVNISARSKNASSSSSSQKTSDDKGVIKLSLGYAFDDYEKVRVKIATGKGSSVGGGGFLGLFAKPWRGGKRTIELAKLEAGANQMPDLQLRKDGYTLVASGRLIHDGGLAIAGATFYVRLTHPTQWGEKTDFIETIQNGSGKRGKFEIRAFDDVGEGKLTLDVKKHGYVLEKPIEIELGQKNMRIMAYRAATVTGTVAPGQTRLLSSLEFHFIRYKDGKPEKPKRVYVTTHGPKFSLPDLMPGEYTLEVDLWRRKDDPVLTIPKLYLNGGKIVEPDVLQGLDLAKLDKAKLVEIKLLLPDGKPATGITVTDVVERGNGWSGRGRRTDERGTVRLLVPKAGGVVRVKTPGYKEVFLRNIDKDTVIKLEK